MNLSALDIAMNLAAAGVSVANDRLSIADRAYACPAKEWVTGPFSSALWRLQTELEIDRWLEEANDCDDFARVAAGFAQILHRRTPDRPPATALAFGEFWYLRTDGAGHAINLALHTSGAITFYEPQTRREVILTEAEKESGTLIRF